MLAGVKSQELSPEWLLHFSWILTCGPQIMRGLWKMTMINTHTYNSQGSAPPFEISKGVWQLHYTFSRRPQMKIIWKPLVYAARDALAYVVQYLSFLPPSQFNLKHLFKGKDNIDTVFHPSTSAFTWMVPRSIVKHPQQAAFSSCLGIWPWAIWQAPDRLFLTNPAAQMTNLGLLDDTWFVVQLSKAQVHSDELK